MPPWGVWVCWAWIPSSDWYSLDWGSSRRWLRSSTKVFAFQNKYESLGEETNLVTHQPESSVYHLFLVCCKFLQRCATQDTGITYLYHSKSIHQKYWLSSLTYWEIMVLKPSFAKIYFSFFSTVPWSWNYPSSPKRVSLDWYSTTYQRKRYPLKPDSNHRSCSSTSYTNLHRLFHCSISINFIVYKSRIEVIEELEIVMKQAQR